MQASFRTSFGISFRSQRIQVQRLLYADDHPEDCALPGRDHILVKRPSLPMDKMDKEDLTVFAAAGRRGTTGHRRSASAQIPNSTTAGSNPLIPDNSSTCLLATWTGIRRRFGRSRATGGYAPRL